MAVPGDLLYSATHEWVRVLPDGNAQMGLTDFAQGTLGDIIFINLCLEGAAIKCGEPIGDVESVMAVSEVISPVDGVVVKVNAGVTERPELINNNPYAAWLIEAGSVGDINGLMTAEEYADLLSLQ